MRRPWGHTTWHGVPCQKCPLDLWTYQEILHEVRPAVVVELGTYKGGSALFLAHVLDQLCDGIVITVDRAVSSQPNHPRIYYLEGRSTSKLIVTDVADRCKYHDGPVLVISDSDHSEETTYGELTRYAPLVTPGSYFIVEDTTGPGPRAAVDRYLGEHPEFSVDREREKFLCTFNPGGYLKRAR